MSGDQYISRGANWSSAGRGKVATSDRERDIPTPTTGDGSLLSRTPIIVRLIQCQAIGGRPVQCDTTLILFIDVINPNK